MQSRYLTAFEHQPIPVGNSRAALSLTLDEAEHLTLLGELRPGFWERGHRLVRLGQYCGIVAVGHRMLEILPKTDEDRPPEECRGLLLRLLRETSDFPAFRHISVGQHLRHAHLLEVFIAAFFDAVAEVLRAGLLRQYKEHEADLQVVRGCIIPGRQFAVLSNRPDRVACRFDELTANNLWNRIAKAGLRAVRPWISSVELNRRWVELMVAFDEVEDARIDVKSMSRLVFDRHAMRYRGVSDWARWILELLSPSLRAGENAAPSLLFDMNLLFESAIATVLRRRAGGGSRIQVTAQETGRYLANVVGAKSRRAFGLRPDLVLRRGTTVLAVGDTKWKRLQISRSGYLMPNPEDIYQMQAYATAFGCEHLALIYPWHSDLTGSKETAFELPASGAPCPTVIIVCIDLHSDPFRLARGSGAPGFANLLAEGSGDTIGRAITAPHVAVSIDR